MRLDALASGRSPRRGRKIVPFYQKLRRSVVVFSDACSVTVHLHLNRTARFLSLPHPGKEDAPKSASLAGGLCAEEGLERFGEAVVHVRRVTTIHYDRNVIRRELQKLNRRADEVSAQLDLCLVTSTVEYDPPFDVNDSFAEAFGSFLGA